MFLSSITTDKTKKFHNSKFLYSLNKIVFLVVGGFFLACSLLLKRFTHAQSLWQGSYLIIIWS